jgi:DNA-binding LacI/PurR family transcriptional regulator
MMVDITDTDRHLYEIVAEDIKEKIKENYFGEEGKIPNYVKLTEIYDVSMSTIKKAMKVLNDENVIISRVGKGTFANKKFNKLNIVKPITQTDKIGLLIRDLEGPYFSGIYSGLADMADKNGKKMMVTVSRDFHQQEDSLLRMMLSHEVDGLVVTTRRRSIYGVRIYDELLKNDIPTVILHDVYDAKVPTVDVDNYKGGRLAAEHLLERSQKKLCVIVGEHGYKTDDLRLEGFLDVLRDQGENPAKRCHIFRYSFSTENTAFDEGYKLGMSLNIQNMDVDGIFVFNDLIAMGFQKAMLERGLSIPEDVAIIGFDNIDRCSEARIPLTTIEVPRYEIGKTAYNVLLQLIEKGQLNGSQSIKLEPKLIVRESA